MKRFLVSGFWFLVVGVGCKTPEVKPDAKPPELSSQEMAIAEQGLTEFKIRFTGQLTAAEAATLEKASYEVVVDGKVVKTAEQRLGTAIAAGATGEFQIEGTSQYVSSAEELKAMDARGGSLLSAIRGTLFVKQGQKTHQLPFARSRDIRVPRLLSVKLHDKDAARFSEKEANIMFYVGVVNPNPFQVNLFGVTYDVTVGGKKITDGVLGKGEKVSPSGTGVFELPVTVSEGTYGPDTGKLIKGRKLAFNIKGELTGNLLQEPYELSGEIVLNVSK